MNWSPALIAEAQALYDQGLTPSRVAERFRKNKRMPDVTGADVAGVISTHRNVVLTSPKLRAKIRYLRETEWVSYTIIAGRLGVSINVVERACVGMRPPKGVKVKSTRSADTMQGQRTDLADARLIRFKQPEPVEVPSWVPDHLFELYEHTARKHDEHVAARIVRDLKRGNPMTFASAAMPSVQQGAA